MQKQYPSSILVWESNPNDYDYPVHLKGYHLSKWVAFNYKSRKIAEEKMELIRRERRSYIELIEDREGTFRLFRVSPNLEHSSVLSAPLYQALSLKQLAEIGITRYARKPYFAYYLYLAENVPLEVQPCLQA